MNKLVRDFKNFCKNEKKNQVECQKDLQVLIKKYEAGEAFFSTALEQDLILKLDPNSERYKVLKKRIEAREKDSQFTEKIKQVLDSLYSDSTCRNRNIRILTSIIENYQDDYAIPTDFDLKSIFVTISFFASSVQITVEDFAKLLGMAICAKSRYNINQKKDDDVTKLGNYFNSNGIVKSNTQTEQFSDLFISVFPELVDLKEAMLIKEAFEDLEIFKVYQYYLDEILINKLNGSKSQENNKTISKSEEFVLAISELKKYYQKGQVICACTNIDYFKELLIKANKTSLEIREALKKMKDFLAKKTPKEIAVVNNPLIIELVSQSNLDLLADFKLYLSKESNKDGFYYIISNIVREIDNILDFINNEDVSFWNDESREYVKSELTSLFKDLNEYSLYILGTVEFDSTEDGLKLN